MNIKFFTPDMLSTEDYSHLRVQRIDMDDWDYIIMCNPGEMEIIPERMFGWGYAKYEYHDDISFRGQVYDIVIAYH